jgi:predicted kinase
VTSASLPVLWLFGPSGVGKTTVGREICARLGASGVRCALIDTDMIGLCLPSNEGDPEHHNLKARNLGALWTAFDKAGAQCLILTGGVEAPHQVGQYVERLPDPDVTVCQLTLSEADHRARIAERNGRSVAWADDLIAEGEELNGVGFADVRVDTGGLTVAESATQILLTAGDWPGVA